MKWFYMRGPGGTIACKGEYEAQAVTEAAECWGCDPAEIKVTGTEEYNGNGAQCAPLQADRLSALRADRLSALQNGRPMTAPTTKRKAAAEGKAP